jgi:uncharacterized surface protein with fasciclin (FAS1) repeats
MSVFGPFAFGGQSCRPTDKYTTFDGSILQYALSDTDLSTLISLVKDSELVDAIGGLKDSTLIAPSNSAFVDLAVDITNKDLIKNVLLYHVTPMMITADNCKHDEHHTHKTLLENQTWSHTPTEVCDALNRKAWIRKHVTCTNGSVIVVKKVLLPQKIKSSDIN